MKILIAPDKFKGSLSAEEVCESTAAALKQLDPTITIQSISMADGGEGTAQLLTTQTHGRWITCVVTDPLFRKIEAGYGISGDGTTAFIEMAAASGLQLLSLPERNPLKTTSFGTGELIADALHKGVKNIVLAIGGSATNDAGIGMAAALGSHFFNHQGKILTPTGENLTQLHSMDIGELQKRMKNITVTVLCDVNNPLSGPQGAAYVFAPQKGADAKTVTLLDQGLKNFAAVVKRDFDLTVEFPGAGAAGGLGAGAKVFLNATLTRGIDYVIEALKVDAAIRNADLIITGEGKMDIQTLSGKVVAGVASCATRLNKPVIALVGKNELTESAWKQLGLRQVISLVDDTTPVEVAMLKTRELILKKVKEQLDFTLPCE